jgi:MoaA/NifB/PqqE/SkfB family radical SAM enzyme
MKETSHNQASDLVIAVSGKTLEDRQHSIEFGPFFLSRAPTFLDLEIQVDLTWDESKHYNYNKLYFRSAEEPFSEERTICFRTKLRNQRESIRLLLPSEATASSLFFRLDASESGVGRIKVISATIRETDTTAPQSVLASFNSAKETTRASVIASEAANSQTLSHYPESLSIELTAGCNLTCSHCSSHGEPELHAFHNRIQRFGVESLRDLADEVFPYLTTICLVGRGEPTFVSSELWDLIFEKAKEYNVLVSMVTNGLLLTKRLRPEHLPWIDTVMFSIDGMRADTMAANRGGASLATVVDAMRRYDDMRQNAELARRPKLSVSWTLKRNNIAEFPDFVDAVAQFEPDLIYARHLLIFFEEQRKESLLDFPDDTNRYLAEAYRRMARHGIVGDCPPISQRPSAQQGKDALSSHGGFSDYDGVWAAKTSDDACDASQVRNSTRLARDRASTLSRRPLKTAVGPTETDNVVAPDELPADRCIYFQRTGVLMADQSLVTCARPYAATVGKFGKGVSFAELWNSETFVSCRAAFGTEEEWDQCRNCWYRESRYAGQRDARATQSDYTLEDDRSEYSFEAWDFREELSAEERPIEALRKTQER